ncbi:hypothetical protein EJ08DRAFT_733254 [Tothia fuscella]|uniref:N-acetyltransferase domain-containing protein n=1 Tax=Tothia fuscella TaxID=1048955 RepID=A0A9P4U060_9PEZI|nr:hypothetical protein EJ08DRAFT_733254 [Tothia fuscella]
MDHAHFNDEKGGVLIDFTSSYSSAQQYHTSPIQHKADRNPSDDLKALLGIPNDPSSSNNHSSQSKAILTPTVQLTVNSKVTTQPSAKTKQKEIAPIAIGKQKQKHKETNLKISAASKKPTPIIGGVQGTTVTTDPQANISRPDTANNVTAESKKRQHRKRAKKLPKMAPNYVPPHLRNKVQTSQSPEPESSYVPPHLRAKAQQSQTPEPTAPTQQTKGNATTLANHFVPAARQPSPPALSDIADANAGLGASKWAARSAFRSQTTAVKHVRIDDPATSQQSCGPQSNSDTTPGSTPNGPATSDGQQSTPTAATTTDQRPQSPSPPATTKVAYTPNTKLSTKPVKQEESSNNAIVPFKSEQSTHRQSKQPSGWLTKEEKQAMRPRDPESDTEHEGWGRDDDDWDCNNIQNLVDWEGNWLPAPVEWEGRRGFKRENYYGSIAEWTDRNDKFVIHSRNNEPKRIFDLTASNLTADNEIAPRDWIPIEVDNQTLQTYWRSLHTSELQFVDEEDAGAIPYWQRYCGNDSDLQIPLEVPEAVLDPADEIDNPGMYRKGKDDANTALERIKENERRSKMSESQKKIASKNERRRLRELRDVPEILPPPNPNSPKINIYLRPATPGDLRQMLEIYNWYAENTTHVPEMVPLKDTDMLVRLNNVEARSLPAIVAVTKSNTKLPKGTRPTLQTTQEKIVGFSYADDHEDRRSLHRYCAELEIYVHHEYLHKGVGKSLLDRMIWLLDPQYKSRDLVEWRVNPDDVAWNYAGSRRVINTVFAFPIYNSDDKVRITWMSRWLEQFGFAKKCELEQCGIKMGHFSTKALFQAQTGANVDPRTAVGVSAF